MLPLDKLELPKSVLVDIAKEDLPSGSIINREAKSAISKAAVVFISYLTAIANEHAGTKKTITTNNVLQGLSTAEFSDFLPKLELELAGKVAFEYFPLSTVLLTRLKSTEYRRLMKEKKESKSKANGTDEVTEDTNEDFEETQFDDSLSAVTLAKKRKASIGSEEELDSNKNRRTSE
ncbi:hypothetical protein K7432_000877 [Basidiobolus ranarum]|uniref:DNA polymerase epsilon subunit D n=1 Tax=Basidiobolus ranarum TaxID=34480 RepID=A0ABR2X3X2_9FUNG